MTETEIKEYIYGLEGKYGVEKWVVENRHIWPLIRIKISFFLRHRHDKEKCIDKKNNMILVRFFSVIKCICSSLFVPLYPLWRRKQNYDVLVFHDNFDRNVNLLDKSFYDKVLDPIVDILNEHKIRVLELERNIGYSRANTYSKSYSVELYFMLMKLCNTLKRKNNTTLPTEYKSFLNDLPSELATELIETNLVREISLINKIASMFKLLLKRHNTKVVVLSCWYSAYNFALSIACSDLNIKSIDVQHGIAGASNHSSYAGWSKFPKDGNYEMMPSLFWAWTKEDAESINAWPTDKVKAYDFGKPVFYTLDNLMKKIDSRAFRRKNLELPVILVSLQCGFELPNWFATYIREHSKCFIWIIRYHPNKDKCQIKFAQKVKDIENVYIDGMDSILLEVLLAEVGVHITYSSSVIVDAYMCGKKSIMLGAKAYDRYVNMIKQKNIIVANNMLELDVGINSILQEQTTVDVTSFVNKKNKIFKQLFI